jgi:plasmid replication initiation protein
MAAVSAGWRFDLRHLHLKSGSLSPFKRFAFELRDIVRRQPLPGYRLARGGDWWAHAARLRAARGLWKSCGRPRAIGNPDYRAIRNPRLVPSGTQVSHKLWKTRAESPLT